MGVFISIIFGVAIAFCLYIVRTSTIEEKEKTQKFIENHKKIEVGMTKKQVIYILGTNYTQSILKSGIVKLEWKRRDAGYTGRIANGAYAHASAITRKISVKFKDDIVVEVNCLNMD